MIKKFAPRLPFQEALFSASTFAPFRIPDFRRLLISNFLWWATRFMEFIIMGWLVLELTDSPWQVAIIGFYRSVPFLFVGFFSGLIIDRFGRRTVILVAQTTNLVISALIMLLLLTDMLALWHLALGSILMGTAWSLDWPSRRSLVPDLVGKAKTVDALLLENLGQNFARIAGPFTAGVLIDAFGAVGAYIALTGLSGLTLFLLSGLSKPPKRSKANIERVSPLTNIIEGLQYVRHSPPILGALLITVAMNFLVFPYMTLMPVFARDVLHQGPTGLGILGSAAGIGSFLGIFIISRIRHTVSNGWIFAAGSCFQALAILTFSTSTNYTLSAALLLLSGIGQACFGIMQSSLILLSASDEMRSRAMGTLVLAIGTGPLGQLQIGALAETWGAPWAVRLQTSLAALVIIIMAFALPDLRRQTKSTPEARPPVVAKVGAR